MDPGISAWASQRVTACQEKTKQVPAGVLQLSDRILHPLAGAQFPTVKLKRGYFWPVYGERDEICFPFFESREIKHVEAALGLTPVERAVLWSDGYAAYAHDVAKMGIIPAPCWAPARRGFFEALAAEPEAAAEALALIGELYSIEEAADPGAGRCP